MLRNQLTFGRRFLHNFAKRSNVQAERRRSHFNEIVENFLTLTSPTISDHDFTHRDRACVRSINYALFP